MIEAGELAGDRYGPRVGERLRAGREAQGLELEDIAARTRIPMRHLQMIERGDYQGLPAATYSAGFIKSYARLLGLDGQELSVQFRDEISGIEAAAQPAPYEPADPRRTPPLGVALLALLAAVVLGLGYLYWRGSNEQASELAAASSDQPVARTPAPAATPVTNPAAPTAVDPAALPPAPAAAATGGPVVITASGDVWIKVSDSGKTLFLGVLKEGDTFPLPEGTVAPLLTTGRPALTKVTVGSTAIPVLGDPDRAAKDVSLKADALLARVNAPGAAPSPAVTTPTPVQSSAALR